MKIEYAPASALLPEMPVELEVGEGDWPGIYPSRIESVAGRSITLLAPIQDGVWVPLRPGTALVARAAALDGLLSWDTRIVERRIAPRPALLVARPGRLMVVQRRDFYRVAARLPVLILPTATRTGAIVADDARREQAAMIVNLSGGGAALRCALPLRRAEWLRVRLPLPDAEGEIVLAGEVVGVDTRRLRWDTERIARVRWSGLSQRDEDRLVRFVREIERDRQRERRAAREVF